VTQSIRVSTLAERWDCSPGKVRAMIKAGELPVLTFGKMKRIPLAAVIAIEAQCVTQNGQDSAGSPDATDGTSTSPQAQEDPAVVSLLARRTELKLKRSSPRT